MHTLKKITLITGGQRSGKSGYAQRLALSQSPNPVYMATSRVWDEEHRQRIIRHQEDRGKEWDNIEEEKYLSKVNIEGRVAVIDCVTLWATNFFFDNDSDTEQSLEEIKKEFITFTQQDASFIFVTNEVGSGGISENNLQNRFNDLVGWVNQFIASQADEVVWMISGIPVKTKKNGQWTMDN